MRVRSFTCRYRGLEEEVEIKNKKHKQKKNEINSSRFFFCSFFAFSFFSFPPFGSSHSFLTFLDLFLSAKTEVPRTHPDSGAKVKWGPDRPGWLGEQQILPLSRGVFWPGVQHRREIGFPHPRLCARRSRHSRAQTQRSGPGWSRPPRSCSSPQPHWPRALGGGA